ncbi:hypothetical protein ROE7235_00117 [Roseibaca ekhonensis]|uniref:Mitochondrial inner membrane protein n=2 Tax=Roseinatronobacter ekhonensis TaxID=254356 RepID=A0A3B0MGX8_9RHOB|nr:hypothetical protein ROE7235_00117 [Roseibaca ekhonensis]
MGEDTASAPDAAAGESAPEAGDTSTESAMEKPDPAADTGTVPETSAATVSDEVTAEADAPDASEPVPEESTPEEAVQSDEVATPTAESDTTMTTSETAGAPSDATVATSEPQTPPIAPPTPAPEPQKRGGFLPLLLGGVVAGGIGYGAHFYQTNMQATVPDEASALTAMEAEIGALRTELADLREAVAQGPDLSDLEAQIAALEPADIGGVQAAIDDLRSRVAAIPEVDEAALQAQIEALRAEPDVDLGPVEDSLAELEAAYAPMPEQMAALQADMDALRALATEEVAQAEAAVDTALATAGLDRIRAALVTGASFDDAVAQLAEAGADVPAALSDAASDGVQTVEQLQDSYGVAARAAIGTSLQAAPAESATEKLGNFFRAQVGARSLAPREGDDPDAVTSRAGAVVAEGDFASALDELSALPDEGRAAMDDWLTAVNTRLNAAAALDALQAEISTE